MRLVTGEKKTRRPTQDKPTSGRPRTIRSRLRESLGARLGVEASWVQRHAAHCPTCRRRLVASGKVDLALSVVKSQCQRLDLPMRANACAVRMLSHSLREAADARGLERTTPEPSLIERCGKYECALTNVAACIVILFLTKTGLFSSLDRARSQGREVMKQYYTSQAGEDLAGEIFEI